MRFLVIGVDEDEHAVEALGGDAAEGIDWAGGFGIAGERRDGRAIEEARRIGEQAIERSKSGNRIVGIAPGKAAAWVHFKFLRGEPLDAAGESVGTAHAGE